MPELVPRASGEIPSTVVRIPTEDQEHVYGTAVDGTPEEQATSAELDNNPDRVYCSEELLPLEEDEEDDEDSMPALVDRENYDDGDSDDDESLSSLSGPGGDDDDNSMPPLAPDYDDDSSVESDLDGEDWKDDSIGTWGEEDNVENLSVPDMAPDIEPEFEDIEAIEDHKCLNKKKNRLP